MGLLIHKVGNSFLHYDDLTPAIPLFLGDFYVDLLASKFRLNRYAGSEGKEYEWLDVRVKVDAGSELTFTVISDLTDYLISIQYPGIKVSNTLPTTPITIFQDGQKAIMHGWDFARVDANFDLNPLSPTYGDGINDMVGWAIDFDASERVSIAWSPDSGSDFNTLGDTGGSTTHMLDIKELCKFRKETLEYSDGKFGVNDIGIGPTVTGSQRNMQENSHSGGKINLTGEDNYNPDGSKVTDPQEAFNILQPYIVELHIYRKTAFSVSAIGLPPQNLESVLNISDRPVILHDVTSGDFTFDTTHIGKYIGFYGEGICNAIIPDDTYDGAKWVNLVGGVSDGAYINLVRTGGTKTTVIGHEKRIISFEAKLTDPDYNGWVINTELPTNLEFQLTQSGTDAPEIVSGSELGFRGAIATTSYESIGIFLLTFSEPILADLKDKYKHGYAKPSFLITPGSGDLYMYTVYVRNNSTLEIGAYSIAGGFPTSIDESMFEPTTFTLEFKP